MESLVEPKKARSHFFSGWGYIQNAQVTDCLLGLQARLSLHALCNKAPLSSSSLRAI